MMFAGTASCSCVSSVARRCSALLFYLCGDCSFWWARFFCHRRPQQHWPPNLRDAGLKSEPQRCSIPKKMNKQQNASDLNRFVLKENSFKGQKMNLQAGVCCSPLWKGTSESSFGWLWRSNQEKMGGCQSLLSRKISTVRQRCAQLKRNPFRSAGFQTWMTTSQQWGEGRNQPNVWRKS